MQHREQVGSVAERKLQNSFEMRNCMRIYAAQGASECFRAE